MKKSKKLVIFLLFIILVSAIFFFWQIINKNDEKSEKPNTENWWLTDEEITYAYQEIAQELGNSPAKKIKLVSPSEVRSIQELEKEYLEEIIKEIKQADIIFFPINNSENHETADSGSHWTLLVLQNSQSSILAGYHYDSLGNQNIPKNATNLVNKLCKELEKDTDYTIYSGKNPQQTNGSDCGVFLIAFTRALAKRFHQDNSYHDWGLKETDLIFSISEERAKLKTAGFPEKGSDGGNYDFGDDVAYLESEEELISQWWPQRDEPFHPTRKCVRVAWNADVEEEATSAYKNADKFKEFSKKVRRLSGISNLTKDTKTKIYRLKKILKTCGLSLEEYKNTKSFASEGNFNEDRITSKESKFIKENINKETVGQINELYAIHFPT